MFAKIKGAILFSNMISPMGFIHGGGLEYIIIIKLYIITKDNHYRG